MCLSLLVGAGGGDLAFEQASYSWCFQCLRKECIKPSDKRFSDISVAKPQTGYRK